MAFRGVSTSRDAGFGRPRAAGIRLSTCVTRAIIGGRSNLPHGDRNSGNKLIYPGGGSGGSGKRQFRDEELAGRRSQLYDPSRDKPATDKSGGLGLAGDSVVIPGQEVAPTYNKYRPPPGFAQQEAEAWTELDRKLKALDKNQLLDMLSTQAGYWHTLAKVIPILNREGFDSKLLEDITGIDSRTQNLWMMASSVFDSLKISSEMSDEEVNYFNDKSSGPVMLAEFRYIGEDDLRIPAAKYIVRHKLSAEDAERLARAVKDYERRTKEEVAGFSYSPGDCMALKFYRDAVEQEKDKLAFEAAIAKALAVPEVSSSALERIERLKNHEKEGEEQEAAEPGAGAAAARPVIEYMRFTDEEIGFRPIGVAGTYGEADGAAVKAVTSAGMNTKFGFFTETGGGHQWMVMPMWRVVAFAKNPVALYVPECSEVDVLAADLKKGEDHETQREGPAVILADKAFDGPVSESAWYLIQGEAGKAEMVEGARAAARPDEVLAKVLMVAKAPRAHKDSGEVPLQL